MKELIRGIFVFLFILFFLSTGYSEDGKIDLRTPSQKIDAPKFITLTTGDLKDGYEILGLITAVTGSTDMDSLRSTMIGKAQSLGADSIIGIQYISHAGSLYCYGTAIKIKKDDKKDNEKNPSKTTKNQ